MDCKQVLPILAFLFMALPLLARGTEHIVGDYYGWTLNFNYTAWAEGKEFRVGDVRCRCPAVFKYTVGKHNVFRVSGPDFQACNVPHESQALITGHDVITLTTPGTKWYFCGVAYGGHCRSGQKLVINVMPAYGHPPAPYYNSPPVSPAPSIPPYRGPTQHVVGDQKGWTLDFNYTAWAEGRQFWVGDTLVFKYPVGVHNVFKVSGSIFEQCSVPPENEAMATGNDVITLATPGKKWYLCGKAQGKHCWAGMKLVITVLPLPSSPAPPLPPSHPAGPRKFIVGDEMGWTLNFNYSAWAEGKEFRVGDILVFKYPAGVHNVFRVDGPDFLACNVPPQREALTTGYDMITLASPGRKWYICGVAQGSHCRMGQKLVIEVLPSASPSGAPPHYKAPSTPPPPAFPGSKQHIVGDYYGWTLNFNYTAWAEGREFRVGDTLVFKYAVGKHDVFGVDGPTFDACHVPLDKKPMTTGYDVITLASPGRKWYMCGKANGRHCQMGMKLFINVLPASWKSPPSGYGRRLLSD